MFFKRFTYVALVRFFKFAMGYTLQKNEQNIICKNEDKIILRFQLNLTIAYEWQGVIRTL